MEHKNIELDPLHYAINLMGEESTEISKEVSKILRFGLFDVRPDSGENNLQILQKEVTDLMATIRIVNHELMRKGLPTLDLNDEKGIFEKIDKVSHYARRSIDRGTLSGRLVCMY